jgi:SAM-dependent methyltransferase
MNYIFYTRNDCRLCGSKKTRCVLPLTPTALCDAYIPASRLDENQEVFPLDLYMCEDCGYLFVPHVVNPEIIYRDYIYITTSSLGLSDHFKLYTKQVVDKVNPKPGTLVIDIGSNDGTLLRHFKYHGLNVLGIEPATETALRATESGVETISDFFDANIADRIVRDFGQATIVTMNNLFANLDNLKDAAIGVRKLLSPEGVFIIESSYAVDMIKNMVFDFIYHEHLSSFSVKPLAAFFKSIDMELVDIDRVSTKGGSLRYYVQLSGGPRFVSQGVKDLISYEEEIGLYSEDMFKDFAGRIDNARHTLRSRLQHLTEQGKKIAGYGGSATTTTLAYHFGMKDFVEYIVDDNPAKQGTYSPGLHIPVFPSNTIYERKPDCIVIFAWRYYEAIIAKHKKYLENGGRFIVPLPEFKEISL